VRTAAFFSPYDPYNFAAGVLRTLAAGRALSAADDLTISPTYLPDLVDGVLDLLIDGATGVRHLANDGAVTWAEFGRRLAAALDLDPDLIHGRPAAAFGWPARRPARAALGTSYGKILPTLESAIQRHAAALRQSDFATEAGAPDRDARRKRAPAAARPAG
jgi:dTDP-4-dehydrorhamnose reductase